MIEVKNLSYDYPDSPGTLKQIHYSQAAGSSVALLGPNGSGKTTFALHLNGILQTQDPSSSQIEISGIRLSPETLEAVRTKVGFVFQSAENQLFLPTVLEDLMFGMLNQNVPVAEARQRAELMLESMHLTAKANKNPFHLSAGEKRRAALAGVVLMQPEILILDEPTTFLDPPGIRELAGLLNSLPLTKLIITHDSQFACNTTQEAVFFDQGQIIARGKTQEIIDRFAWH